MLPSRCSSPCLGGARSHTSSIFWDRGSNESKRKSKKCSEMQDPAFARTFQPHVVPIYVCKNRYAPVPFARLHVWGVQGATRRAFSGNVSLTCRNASQ
jgi:hypothetical protein